MFGRSKWTILIPAIVLIPFLLGMMPLNFIHNLGSGCPFSHEKLFQKCSPGSVNSQGAQDGHLPVAPESVFLHLKLASSFYDNLLNSELLPSLGLSEFPPLRC
jgi:hypothetical protein